MKLIYVAVDHMPENCYKCDYYVEVPCADDPFGKWECLFTGDDCDIDGTIPDSCPLKEVKGGHMKNLAMGLFIIIAVAVIIICILSWVTNSFGYSPELW